ncbi:MAG: hypothetical protein PHZ07_01340 [Patescibacteria group bacterium]|nr:hypothetical protein [Patescibacteria group bacterium]MDD4303920.1 hypothetical protein [Patescibacteria group bacterium]MDD4695093.1 hypothetical protein [Patescibacteria group bacterium]
MKKIIILIIVLLILGVAGFFFYEKQKERKYENCVSVCCSGSEVYENGDCYTNMIHNASTGEIIKEYSLAVTDKECKNICIQKYK